MLGIFRKGLMSHSEKTGTLGFFPSGLVNSRTTSCFTRHDATAIALHDRRLWGSFNRLLEPRVVLGISLLDQLISHL